MTSKEALKEFYKIVADNVIDKIPNLYESIEAIQSWIKKYYTIEKDLDRLEKLEKTFDILTAVLDRVLIFKFKEDIINGGNIYISKIDSNNTTIVNLRKPEFDLLKEVFYNGV